ncbi:HNH endonuclease [Salana multivorans]|uniref:HNH endonuclease n=1 Tax=Salana multivorans TaxID=120377 RepID=A0A3N2D9D6_9MICO|nr:HNH endonuclease [Salana multivorans]ROR96248.1 HNH endonuclease [Salana multivorans]
MAPRATDPGSGRRSFWSCFTREFSNPLGNLYGDVVGEHYDYDSRVPNSRQVAEGDVLVLRDERAVYGWGVVERVESWAEKKNAGACPRCELTSRWTERLTRLPRYRCSNCGEEFDEPVPVTVPVTMFEAHYGSSWTTFAAQAPVRGLKDVYASADQQNAIRRLDPVSAVPYIDLHQGVATGIAVEIGEPGEWSRHGGFAETRTRVRRFQDQFRDRLLTRYGEVCAVTGVQPREALDAAHLYSYATRPVHEANGGLLLRKDVHGLFDAMLLTIDPDSLQSQVAPPLVERYPGLGWLDGRALTVPRDRLPRLELLDAHADASRERWASKALRDDLAGRSLVVR